jgi:queuosine biosynthesis protein QueD
MNEATLYISRKIAAAHYLPEYEGNCSRMHGHTWKIEVWLHGEVQSDGMVVDFREVKDVIDELDHKCLNDVLPNPTSENLALYLLEKVPYCRQVRVWESDDAYAEVSRE